MSGRLWVVIDGWEDWVPFGVFSDGGEAIRAKEMLSADAECDVKEAPFYPDRQAARDDEPAAPDPADEYVVSFDKGGDIYGLSTDDFAAREAAIQKAQGGMRTAVPHYETAEEMASDRPASAGAFIASELTADDLMEALR